MNMCISAPHCIYSFTSLLLLPPSLSPSFNARALAASGLIVIAFGTGGIKPCVATFGGEQFKGNQVNKQATSTL